MKLDIEKERNKETNKPPFARAAEFKRELVNKEKRTMEVSFSSEMPVERWGWEGEYYEVLGHKKGEINEERMSSMNYLHDHNWTDIRGVVENHKFSETEGKGRCEIRFGSTPECENSMQLHAEGIRKNISFGYDIHEYKEIGIDDVHPDFRQYIKRNIPIIRITRWTPLEISSVAVPADQSVGVARSNSRRGAAREGEVSAEMIEADPEKFVDQFEFEEDGKTVKKDGEGKPVKKIKSVEVVSVDPVISVEERKKIEKETRLELQKRSQEIRKIAEMPAFKGNDKVAELVREYEHGTKSESSLDEFKTELLERAFDAKAVDPVAARIGLSEKERANYSILKAIRGQIVAKNGGRWEGLEAEASREIAKRLGKEPEGFYVPDEALSKPMRGRRDLSTLTLTGGGATVETEVMYQDFISLLRNRMIAPTLGVRILNGLQGNVAIPKQTGAATAYWVAENAAPSESDQSFGQVAMTPRQLRAYTNISKQLIAQSSNDMEGIVRDDLAMICAIALDSALINGTGADGQPLGLLNQPGLSIVSLGTNGAAPTKAANVQLKTNVAAANADFGNLAYLTNAQGRGKQETTVEVSGFPTFLWKDGPARGVGELPMGSVEGYPAFVSNQVPSTLTKGSSGAVCSAQIYGNWESAMIGRWANALDILVNPYSLDTTGEIRITVGMMADVNFRYIPSFSAIVDMLTT